MLKNYEAAGHVAERVMNNIRGFREGGNAGISTGYSNLDGITGGLYPGELVIIAGRPAMGKTALSLNIVRNLVITSKNSVGFLSLEDGKEGIVEKIMTIDALVDSTMIRAKDLSEYDIAALEKSVDRIAKAKLYISNCENTDIDSICSICDDMKKDDDVQIIFIDYAQLITANEDMSVDSQISYVLFEIKKLATRLQIPIVLMSQLSQEVDNRNDHRPTVSDFSVKEVFDVIADIFLFVYRDDYYNLHSDMKGIAEIIVAKRNAGKVGTARMHWSPIYYFFSEV